MSLFGASSRACATFGRHLSKMRTGPCPIGKVLHKPQHHETILDSMRVFGWHAGPFSKLEKQIYNGKFDKRNIDIYFGNK
ncbi:MAG: hypothetical protein K940chlam1_01041, partial [Candidatus Anoxychlamydiales bacterium]|nr:hypothetical protein [Candidatus Anoxychlamydiales bacterium]